MKSRSSISNLIIFFLMPMVLGIGFTFGTVGAVALAQNNVGKPPEMVAVSVTEFSQKLSFFNQLTATLPFSIPYARVVSDKVLVYQYPWFETFDMPPTRTIRPGFVFVSLENKEAITSKGEWWYQINQEEFILAQHVVPITPSQFQGITFSNTPERPFGWVIRKTPVLSGAGMSSKEATQRMARYDRVTIFETKYYGKAGWHRIGENEWVASYDVGKVKPISHPTEIPPNQNWIEVNLFEQSLAAYEGDRMVYATLVSSGLPGWDTPSGLFHVYAKVKIAKMSGGGLVDWYFLEDVTDTMYFTSGYALHGAYWHDDFGRYKSHGCVNMSPKDAHWLFNWTTPDATNAAPDEKIKATKDNPGTWVWVHE